MQPRPENENRQPKPTQAENRELEQLTEQQLRELQDPAVQEQYRKEMLRELRLRQCPGCGEDELF